MEAILEVLRVYSSMLGSVAGLMPARRQQSARMKAIRENSKARPGTAARYAVNIVEDKVIVSLSGRDANRGGLRSWKTS